jgi:hypothetical protein
MRVPVSTHGSRPWRIHEIAPDFTVEDVWDLPVHGDAGEFQSLLDVMRSLDPAQSGSAPTRVLWRLRDCLGRAFGLGRISETDGSSDTDRDDSDDASGHLPIPGTTETSLIGRLPEDLRNTAPPTADSAPFVPLYRTDDEYAAELSNRTVHAVMHLAWVDRGDGSYQGQMTVYVKPRGRFGKGYMAFIKPFRYWVVYPELMRLIERSWDTRAVE